jgi:hypothetical protein
VLPAKPGCISSPHETLSDKIKEWLKHITH